MKTLIYNNRVIKLKPYLTRTERDLLVLAKTEINDVLTILEEYINVRIDNKESSFLELSETEKVNILHELRRISVSEVFSFIRKCPKCNNRNEIEISLPDVLIEGKIEDFKGISLKNIISDNINDFSDSDLDELDLDLYDDLKEYIDNNKTRFDFNSIIKCHYCSDETSIELDSAAIIKNLSEDTVLNFYQTISSMVYFGKYSKLDVDSMLPFERSIYLGLLNEQIKKNKE